MRDDPVPDLWLTCPECHNVMVPLGTYEIQDSAIPGLDADPLQMMIFGWWSIVYNFFFGAAKMEGEKVKLAKEKREILPQFPHSQICPKCFHVVKKA